MKTINKILLTFSLFSSICQPSYSQEKIQVRDTLPAAIKNSVKSVVETGHRSIGADELRMVVSPMGETDVIKFIQIMPGVSSGVEGSSSFYVRGGNMGNNLVTLDGVTIYGNSHLLGFTTVFSTDIVSKMDYYVGGFLGEDGNLLSSSVKISSIDGDFEKFSGKASISNFLINGFASTPIVTGKLSFVGSFRISPIKLEYEVLKRCISKHLSFDYANAGVYDLFGKFKYKANEKNEISLSVFNSLDNYRYGTKGVSDDGLKWGNLITNLQWNTMPNNKWNVKVGLSYNGYLNEQFQKKIFEGHSNALSINSSIDEITLSATAYYKMLNNLKLTLGGRIKTTYFNPGSSKSLIDGSNKGIEDITMTSSYSWNITNTLFAQIEMAKNKCYQIRLSTRVNAFISNLNNIKTTQQKNSFFDPEVSLLANYKFIPQLGIEGTIDCVTQYYHTLEGMPLGWSMDMKIPTSASLPPEHSKQLYLGLFSTIDSHRISVGGYYKKMSNLVNYIDASLIFGSSLAGWEDNVDVGKGTSYGGEFLYEMSGKRLSYKLAYTLSKTDRKFPNINFGKSFPAKLDRTHILNLIASYVIETTKEKEMGVNTFFTLQSGNWESVKSAIYTAYLPIVEEQQTILDYYSHPNNYRMPMYIRWDVGCYFKFFRKKTIHNLTVGIYNILNRHNPFSLYYNPKTKQWMEISILPIMPSVSYCIELF